ncbi:hypothetical protein CAEBREN_10018 [Caenorhabditis brenneri]|uniref:Skp1-related protein n=1 Tax=Caenorhabditis brenneri TaxID=135651 RepID=G0MZ24_CAEBE|nr:hypothetical protein CAEBREN_10018 [Caenorhabditis brenneri]
MSAEAAPVVADTAAPEGMYYRVAANDGVEFKVSELAIQQSETLQRLVSTMCYTPEDVEKKDAIPIENIDGATLKLVFEWCEHHKGEAIPEDDDSVPKNVVIPEFDAKLMEIDNEQLFNLICAANYLNIKQLLNVSCKKVANMAKGKSPEELRVIFEIPTDEEDEAAEKAAKEAEEKAAKEAAEKKAAEKDTTAKGGEEKNAADKETEKDVQGTSESA